MSGALARLRALLPVPQPAPPRASALVFVLCVVALGVVAAQHPGLRFVDFTRFSERARELLGGQHLVDPLYPLGYPAVLAALVSATGPALVVGKAMSVLAAGALAYAVASQLGAGTALFVMSCHAMIVSGSTEGTDAPACALALSAVLLAKRPGLAATLVGLAVLVRYTAIAAVPVVLFLSARRGMTVGTLALVTAPHWLVAVLTGESPLPDQSQNLAIGAGHAVSLLSVDTLARLPTGTYHALSSGLHEPALVLGLAGLARGIARRDRVAIGLAAYLALHAAGLGLGFSNGRLALPITACAACGVAWLLPSRLALVAALAIGAFNGRIPADNDEEASRAARVADVLAGEPPGPVFATSAWFYRVDGPWIHGATQLSSLGPPRSLTPQGVAAAMRARGAAVLALDVARTRREAPGLEPLLSGKPPPGYTALGHPRGWRLWRLDAD